MRYFTGFLIAIGLIVLIFIIIFKGSGSPKQQQLDLNSYANSEALVQLTIDGPVTADQTHQSLQISIGRSESQIQVMQGYQSNVTASKTYQNNQASYEVFLRALNLNGFTKGVNDPKQSDERGACATGERYVFGLVQGIDNLQRYWATSCGGSGTYRGSITQVLSLFKKQIPDYDSVTAGFLST